MSFHKRRRPSPPRSDEVCPEGDAAHLFFDLESPRTDHRDRSLCRQAQEALLLAFAEAAHDPRLDEAWIASVDPAPGSGRLLVSVVMPKASDYEAALAALAVLRPWLRSEVAQAIHRKRAPELAFRVLLEDEAPNG